MSPHREPSGRGKQERIVAPGLVCLKREVAAFKLRGSSACLKERWPSGRRRTPGTRVGGQPSRGFESHPLRHPTTFGLRAAHHPKAARAIFRSLNVAISCVYGIELTNAL